MTTPPSTPRRKRLDRDQRRDILLLRRRGDSYAEIAKFLDVTERAVQYTYTTKYATPKHKKAGRPLKLTSDKVDKLIEYVKTLKQTRRMTYQGLKDVLYSERDEIRTQVIKYTLHKRGYFRRITLRKPLILERNRICRLK
jgi:transposase